MAKNLSDDEFIKDEGRVSWGIQYDPFFSLWERRKKRGGSLSNRKRGTK